MIKKLKMRFVLVNMLILSLVLFSTLSAIYIMMANSEIKVSNEIMDTLIENHKKSMPFDKDRYHINDEAKFLSVKDSEGIKLVPLALIENVPNNEPNEKTPKNEHENGGGNNEEWKNPWENGNPWGNGQWTAPPTNEDPWGQWSENPWGNPWGYPWGWGDPWGGGNPWEYTWFPPEQSEPPESEISETAQPSEPPMTAVTEPPEETQPATAYEENTAPVIPSEMTVTQPPETEAPQTSSEAETTNAVPETPSTAPSEPQKHREPLITTKYNGNLIRSHIFAEIGSKSEILDISYQYFFQYDDAEYHLKVRDSINEILSSGDLSGKYVIENISYRYKLSDIDPNGMKFLILLDRSIEISTLHRLMITFIIIGCAGLIVVFFVSLLLANWAIKPIEIAWNRQKQFIADASHELKTPLTVIATNTDLVLSTPNDLIRDQERWLRYIKSETARMSKLVNELLYIAKSDANEIKMEMSEFDISNTISGICLIFEPMAFEAGRELVSEISPRMRFFGDEDRIKQLITILIDNAIKYSLPSSQISVSLSRNNQGRIRFCISNSCEEMTQENVSKLFDRFYRVDSSRNSSTGGNGLGLNIAQTITEAHNGTITVNYNYGMISFTVLL